MENSDANSKQNTKHKTEKTFEELVEESIRLPSLSPSGHLPMSMTEILRSSQKSKDITTKLPQIHSGKVQLVTRGDGIAGDRKRRRGHKTKVHRPDRPSPEVSSDNVNSVRVTVAKPPASLTDNNHARTSAHTEQAHWKKKLHKRQSKRRIAEETDPLNVSITISGYYNGYRI